MNNLKQKLQKIPLLWWRIHFWIFRLKYFDRGSIYIYRICLHRFGYFIGGMIFLDCLNHHFNNLMLVWILGISIWEDRIALKRCLKEMHDET